MYKIQIVIIIAVGFLLACDEAINRDRLVVPPSVGLAQSGKRTVDLKVAGPEALRGIQATVLYDVQSLRLTKVEAGADATRLDKVFWSDPTKANGTLVVGVTDTRRVALPARGTLIRMTFEPVGTPTVTKVQLNNVVGAREGGKKVALDGAALSLKVQ